MKRRFVFGLVTVALLINLGVGARIYLSAARASTVSDNESANLRLFSDAMEKIRTQYVDGTNLTYQKLVYSALRGVVDQLDPHSEFLDVKDYQQLQDDTEGQFGGLGLVVSLRGGYVTVVSPIDDTPGSRAGILAGDRIVKVEGRKVKDMPLEKVVDELRGKPGTKVRITVERPKSGTMKNYALTRAVIHMRMVKDINGKTAFPIGPDHIGYIRIAQFGDHTGRELQAALTKLKRQGMKGLILDLRWNPGGLLDQAVKVCQQFVPRGQLIVSTEGRHTLDKYFAHGRGDELKGVPIVVLVNLGTASAAEIVTGCLQDLHRAVILGEKTFGKGSVQTIFPLGNGSALKLTVAKYYTPSHRVIHEHGITPDIRVPLTDTQEAALLIKRAPGGINALPAKEQAIVKPIHDRQLERAEELLAGLQIYDHMIQTAPGEKMAAK